MNDKNIKISASLMCCNFLEIGKEVVKLENSGVDMFHIDIMDGSFVKNFAMSCYEMRAIKEITKVPLDVHLMIDRPEDHIENFIKSGADILTVHIETCRHINKILQKIKGYGTKSGVALNPGTSYLFLEPVLDYIDIVLIMSVNPGSEGQSFIPSTYNKVRRIRKFLDELGYEHIQIQVDGAICKNNIKQLHQNGADIFVLGTSGLFYGDMEYEFKIALLKAQGQG